MLPSSEMCRVQEAYQRDRAACTEFENVRVIAEKAANAWRQEGILAEDREARRIKVRANAKVIALRRQQTKEADRLLSENPDRGFADL